MAILNTWSDEFGRKFFPEEYELNNKDDDKKEDTLRGNKIPRAVER
jgi:hypothetical protein